MASDRAVSDYFGRAVAVAGATAVVGAYGDDTAGGTDTGSVYVFVRSAGVWTEQAKLVASDGTPFDHLGYSVDVDGDTAVVGANTDEGPAGEEDAGSAYVFARSGSIWTQQAKLTASDGGEYDEFGFPVAVSGDTVVVGAPYHDTSAGSGAGSAYVFVRSGTAWTEQAKLTPSDGIAGGQFGLSVAVTGDTAVVGAAGGAINVGTAYVFVRSGTAWTEQAKLVASDGAAGDYFGASVTVTGDTAVVGAHSDSTLGGTLAGSAYVFVRSGTTWTEQAHLVASDGASYDRFGISVAVSGNLALVSAAHDDTPVGFDTGSVYVFVRSGSTWTERAHLTAPRPVPGAYFGDSVALSGATLAVGATTDYTSPGIRSGSAYVLWR